MPYIEAKVRRRTTTAPSPTCRPRRPRSRRSTAPRRRRRRKPSRGTRRASSASRQRASTTSTTARASGRRRRFIVVDEALHASRRRLLATKLGIEVHRAAADLCARRSSGHLVAAQPRRGGGKLPSIFDGDAPPRTSLRRHAGVHRATSAAASPNMRRRSIGEMKHRSPRVERSASAKADRDMLVGDAAKAERHARRIELRFTRPPARALARTRKARSTDGGRATSSARRTVRAAARLGQVAEPAWRRASTGGPIVCPLRDPNFRAAARFAKNEAAHRKDLIHAQKGVSLRVLDAALHGPSRPMNGARTSVRVRRRAKQRGGRR